MDSCTIIIKDDKGKTLRNATLHDVDEVRNFYYEACKAGLFDEHYGGPYFLGNLEDVGVERVYSHSNALCTKIPLHESDSRATCRCCNVDMTESNRLKAIAYAFSQSVPSLETRKQIIVTD